MILDMVKTGQNQEVIDLANAFVYQLKAENQKDVSQIQFLNNIKIRIAALYMIAYIIS